MRSDTYFKEILNVIKEHEGGFFKVNQLNNYISEVIDANNNFFYIIYESIEVYTKMDNFIDFSIETSQIDFFSDNLLRIPFFAGCSSYDLGNFLYGDNRSLDQEIDYSLLFEREPIDFNFYGLERFITYLDIIKRQPPIFKSNNIYENYIEYFMQKIDAVEGRYRMILPLGQLLKLKPENQFLLDLIQKIEEKYGGKANM